MMNKGKVINREFRIPQEVRDFLKENKERETNACCTKFSAWLTVLNQHIYNHFIHIDKGGFFTLHFGVDKDDPTKLDFTINSLQQITYKNSIPVECQNDLKKIFQK